MPKKQKGKSGGPRIAPRALLEKEDGEEYGLVTRKLGSGRFHVKLNMQNKEVVARLAGKFRHGASKKANLVDVNSVVLLSIRDFQDNVADIIHVYRLDEARQLKKSGAFVEESVHGGRNDDDTVEFEEEKVDEANFDFDEI